MNDNNHTHWNYKSDKDDVKTSRTFNSVKYSKAPRSEFKGGYFDYIGRIIIGFLITAITFGIMLPWAVVIIKRYEINNTYIEGYRLRFDGTAMQLFGNYIKWWFFTIITFGIYGFITQVKMRQWVVKHTFFA